MIRKLMPVLLLTLALVPGACAAEQYAVLVIVDGLGSAYVYPGQTPLCVDGSPLEGAKLDVVGNASATYELWVPVPETESGNAVIVTGYSGASGETVAYYGATIYDTLQARGYLCMAVLETGDTVDMIAEPDVIIYDGNNSAYNPEMTLVINNPAVPDDIADLIKGDPPARLKARSDPGAAYRQYDNWPLEKAIDIVRYMCQTYPGQKYLLVVNVAGTDIAAQERGYSAYCKAIEDLDAGLSGLADACTQSGIVMVITADHGMSFKTTGSKGTHASGAGSVCNETRLVPLMVFDGEKQNLSGIYGQQCLAPTLLSLMECPDLLTVADGIPIPGSGSPSLYLVSDGPVDATVESPGFFRQVTVNGTCRIGPVAPGDYRITLPWGVRAVGLEGDVTIRLDDTLQGRSSVSWVPYIAAAVVSAGGILAGLGLMRRRLGPPFRRP